MAFTGRSRQAVGGSQRAFQSFAAETREEFEREVVEAGFTVDVVKVDKGAWNERREFFVNGARVGVAFKGEKPDWASFAAEADKAVRA